MPKWFRTANVYIDLYKVKVFGVDLDYEVEGLFLNKRRDLGWAVYADGMRITRYFPTRDEAFIVLKRFIAEDYDSVEVLAAREGEL